MLLHDLYVQHSWSVRAFWRMKSLLESAVVWRGVWVLAKALLESFKDHWWLHTSTLWRIDISGLDAALAMAEKEMWWGPCCWENLHIEHHKDRIAWEMQWCKKDQKSGILKPRLFDKKPVFFQGTCLFMGFGFFWYSDVSHTHYIRTDHVHQWSAGNSICVNLWVSKP